ETTSSKMASETPVESETLKNAREYEQQERYSEAVNTYEQYVQMHPRAADTSTVSDRIAQLKKFKEQLADARAAMDQQDYLRAAQQYKMALELRPESQVAREGFQDAKTRAALRAAESAPNMRPPEGMREGMRPGP